MSFIRKLFGNYSEKEIKKIIPIKEQVLELDKIYSALSTDELREKTAELKERLKNGAELDDILPDAFATCREASWRVLGMKHFPVQILGGIILHQGRISEMKTGEGKTLVATLPAYLNALSGKGVHIVTVNDYLAKRDSEWMGKVYRFLGLTVGLVVPGMDKDEKRKAYEADITYCTNNELGFDYLRDNMVVRAEDRVQRGFNFAIVDEVDSILIDEARTPLIISGRGNKSTELYTKANALAKRMVKNVVVEKDDKLLDEEQHFDGDYVVDEKAKSVTLTPQGEKKAEEFFGIERLNDVSNLEIAHHVQQAIRAHGIMKRDIDYIVKDGEVLIVDEFTGRIMVGRRYNNGLHQAIEAKEGVNVAHESQTLATITFQNFFRMYSKLSGMTGTAMTEEGEFQEIYKLDVVEIPTNKPVVRIDYPDVVYKTINAKYEAVIKNIEECQAKGQPVLVGTVSVEVSEKLSALLKKRGIKHNVLNAKYHEREAEIIAQAGHFGAVTIATNMAGRGTDIMLGGNAEYLAKSELKKAGYTDETITDATGFGDTDNEDILTARKMYNEAEARYKAEIAPEAEKVRNAGGLFIIGTERHDSRRIDNQLRGRSGRQGDPGASKFYLSLEDDLMRLFGGSRVSSLMDTFKLDEDVPIDAKLISRVIESAQEKVEGKNFAIRKSVIDYDDVMNKQRELIYEQRNKVIDGENVHDSVVKMIDDSIKTTCDQFVSDNVHDNWNLEALRNYYKGWLTTDDDFHYDNDKLGRIEQEDIEKELYDRAMKLYADREAELGEEMMREVERFVLLRTVDIHWMEHIDAMDMMREGIGLRAYGQHDPIVEYRNEGYDMFNAMTEDIREQTAKGVLTVRVKQKEDVKQEKVAEETATAKNLTVKGKGVVAKNALCPCGSGLKYKRCCGKDQN